MRTLLDQLQRIDEVTHVVIENQISTLATRMKTIQGMLAQYFIMRCPTAHIEFVSSANKLKGFVRPRGEPVANTLLTPSQKYREHKVDGLVYCSELMTAFFPQDPWLGRWTQVKKRDDLADCFLQGIWYWRKVIDLR
jgi:hypothetical protein